MLKNLLPIGIIIAVAFIFVIRGYQQKEQNSKPPESAVQKHEAIHFAVTPHHWSNERIDWSDSVVLGGIFVTDSVIGRHIKFNDKAIKMVHYSIGTVDTMHPHEGNFDRYLILDTAINTQRFDSTKLEDITFWLDPEMLKKSINLSLPFHFFNGHLYTMLGGQFDFYSNMIFVGSDNFNNISKNHTIKTVLATEPEWNHIADSIVTSWRTANNQKLKEKLGWRENEGPKYPWLIQDSIRIHFPSEPIHGWW